MRQILLLVLGIFTLVILFSNCSYSKVEFKSLSAESFSGSDKANDSDNGYGYGGKAIYNRYLPDFGCESKPTALASIEITKDSAQWTERNPFLCDTPQTPINKNDLDTSPLQKDVIGYQTGLYMNVGTSVNVNVEPNISGVPDKLAEAWCRDEQNPNVDVITHYDRIQQKAFAKIYYRNQLITNNILATGEFSTARIISNLNVNYSADNFKLSIDRDNLAVMPGTFWGQLYFSDNGQNFQKKVFCRLGGNLDPKIWPATKVNILPALKSSYDKSTDSIIYLTHAPGISGLALFSSKNNKTEILVGPNQFGSNLGLWDFQLSQAGQVLFRVSETQSRFTKLFSFDFASKQISLLNGTGPINSPGVANDFIFNNEVDAKGLVFFRSNAVGTTSSNLIEEQDLYMSDMVGEKIRLSETTNTFGSRITHFTLGKVSKKIAYSYYDMMKDKNYLFVVVNLDGSDRKIFNPSQMGFSYVSEYISLVGDDQILLFRGSLAGETLTNTATTYGLSLNDGQAREIRTQGGASSGITPSSPSGRYLSYAKNVKIDSVFTEYFIRDMSSWKEISLGSLDFQGIRSLQINETEKWARMIVNQEIIEIDLISGLRKNPCPNNNLMTVSNILPNNNGSVTYITKALKQGDHYQVAIFELINNVCLLKNTILLANSWTEIKAVAPDSTGILILAQPVNRSYISLVHIPLNGKPAIQLNAPAIINSSLWGAYYVKDGSRVIFEGRQLEPNSSDIYSIDLPRNR